MLDTRWRISATRRSIFLTDPDGEPSGTETDYSVEDANDPVPKP